MRRRRHPSFIAVFMCFKYRKKMVNVQVILPHKSLIKVICPAKPIETKHFNLFVKDVVINHVGLYNALPCSARSFCLC